MTIFIKKFAVLIFLMALVPGLPFVSSTLAGQATLTDIVVTNTRDHLLVYFGVSDCLTQDMIEAIDSGINTTFVFHVKLYEVERYRWDQKIADLTVRHDIQYDSLKKVYRVRLSEKNDETVTVGDFDQAKKLMSQIVGLRVTSLENLRKGKRYQVRMIAELDKIRLPFYLHHVLFFLSLWDFETDWYTVDFTY